MTSIPSGITQLDWPVKVGQDRPVTFELPDDFDTADVTVIGGPAGAVEATVTPIEGGVEVLWSLADLASLILHPWELIHAGVTVIAGTVTTARPSDPGGLEHVTVSLADATVQVTAVLGAGTGSGVSLGETSSTAYRGDRGKTAYDHSQATGNPHGTAMADIGGLVAALAAKEATGVAAALVDDLSGVTDPSTARTNLGLGTAATHATGDYLASGTRLDQITAPNTSVAFGSQKITGLANGTTSTDAAAYGQLTYPKRLTIACATAPPNTYTTWTPTISAVSYGGYAAGAATGETWTFDLVMAAGTWSIRWVRRTTSTSGIITPTLGGTSLTTVDCYSAGNAEASATQTGITISTAGYVSLVLTNPTKNASSAGYGFIVHGIELWRTAP